MNVKIWKWQIDILRQIKMERIYDQQTHTSGDIKGCSLKKRKMIPDGIPEIQKEIKMKRKGKMWLSLNKYWLRK